MRNLLGRIWRALGLPKNIQLSIMRVLQDQFLVGVTGVILNEKNEVLVFKHSYRQIQWSLPGGYIKKGEHPAESLEREIKEESGLTVSVDRELKIRTDRSEARLDIGFTGAFIGGEFVPSKEVSGYGFFAFDALPLISRNQLALIDGVLKQNSRLAHLTPLVPIVPKKLSFGQKLKGLFTS